MEEVVLDSYIRYFNSLSKFGYKSQADVNKLIVFSFLFELVNNDYRGLISEKDYKLINSALYCLFGTTCLIPYPNYTVMGILKIGDITELSNKIKALSQKDIVQDQSIENINNEIDDLKDYNVQNDLEILSIKNDIITANNNVSNLASNIGNVSNSVNNLQTKVDNKFAAYNGLFNYINTELNNLDLKDTELDRRVTVLENKEDNNNNGGFENGNNSNNSVTNNNPSNIQTPVDSLDDILNY